MKNSSRKIKKPVKPAKKKPIKKISKTISSKKPIAPKGWQPLRDLALHSPYTMGYLSLMARRRQLKVKKIGRIWYSNKENIKEFEEKMELQKQERNERLRNSFFEKAENVKISVMDDSKAGEILKQVQDDSKNAVGSRLEAQGNAILEHRAMSIERVGDTIFDEVQNELQEILQEIRAREKKLRHDYMVYRGDAGKQKNVNVEKEKQATEELSTRLITDMGKLLKTANDIHESAEFSHEQHPVAPWQMPHGEHDHLLGNYHKDNFLSVPYSYFPFEDKKYPENSQKPVSMQNKVLLFLAGVMVFIAAVLLVLVILG